MGFFFFFGRENKREAEFESSGNRIWTCEKKKQRILGTEKWEVCLIKGGKKKAGVGICATSLSSSSSGRERRLDFEFRKEEKGKNQTD